MRARLGLIVALVALAGIGLTAGVRWTYFSQVEHPTLRLSEHRGPRLTDRLVILLVDSVPFDMAFTQGKLPFIASLRPRGTHGTAVTEEPSMTGQMVYTIATGMRPFLYGVVRNWRQNRLPHETVLDALRAEGLRLELYGDVPWTQMFGDRLHHHFTLPEDGRRADGRPYNWRHAVNDLDLQILPHVDRALAAPRFGVLLWHLHGTDLVMHKYLRDSRLTAEKLAWGDLLVEGVVRQLDDGRTTFLILSDHGCAANGRHGYTDPEAKNTFYLLLGPRITPGLRLDLRQVDLAPTLAALFGRSPPAASAGRPAVEALTLAPGERARVLVDAARNRARYLAAREQRQPTGAVPPATRLQEAERALAAGEPARAGVAASAYLRQAYQVDLDARRQRSWGWPVAMWLGLLGLLVGLGVVTAGAATPPTGGTRRGALWPALVAGLGLAVIWAAGLAAATWNGRFFNEHFDLWRPVAQAGFWAGLLAALAGLGVALYRPVRRAAAARPGLWTWAACVALAILPGYFQGLYWLVFALGLLGLAAWRRGDPAPRAWIGLLASAVVLGICLVWEESWRPHFFHLRPLVRGAPGAALAGVGFLVAALGVLRPYTPARPGETRPWRAVAILVALVVARHLAWPQEPRDLFPTVGDQLLAPWPLSGMLTAFAAAAWWALRRWGGLRGPEGATLGALAVLAVWSTPFEALAFSLLVGAFAPLGRLRWLEAPGLPGAALAAAVLVLARSVFVQVHEFHFNFTSIHDLLRFAPDTDTVLPALAVPVALRYALPALVLVPLLWGRLSARQRVAALGVALVFAGARVLHLLVITRLTIDQLYANWRGLGELILTGLLAVSLVIAVVAWEIGVGWAARPSRDAARGSADAAPAPAVGPTAPAEGE